MRFRKKPVEVEAIEFVYTAGGIEALRDFCGDALGKITKARNPFARAEAEIKITEDSVYIITESDWIIRGIHGEFYSCKPDVFWKTYDLV